MNKIINVGAIIILSLALSFGGCAHYYDIKAKKIENILTEFEMQQLGIKYINCECANDCICIVTLIEKFETYNYTQIEIYIEQRLRTDCTFYYDIGE